MRYLVAALLVIWIAAPAAAMPYWVVKMSTGSATAEADLAGKFCLSTSTKAAGCIITIDGRTGTFMLNTNTLPAFAQMVSSGTLVVQSTSSAAGNPVLRILNNAGTELFRVQQDGKVGISSGTPTDALSIAGSINTDTGLKWGSAPGSNVALTGTQSLCGANYHNGIPVGGSACTSGSGDVTQAGANTMTGGTTFTSASTVTVNGTFQSNGLNFSVPIASASFTTAVTTMSITIPTGYAQYYMVVVGTSTYTSNTSLGLRFDNNSGAVYTYGNTTAGGTYSCNGANGISITFDQNRYVAGTPFNFSFLITPTPSFFNGAATRISGTGVNRDATSGADYGGMIGATYSAIPTSIQLVDYSSVATCPTHVANTTAGLEGAIWIYGVKQ